jgi:hypothetical protein
MGLTLTTQLNAAPKGETYEQKRDQPHPLRPASMTRPRGNGERDQHEVDRSERKLLDVLGH